VYWIRIRNPTIQIQNVSKEEISCEGITDAIVNKSDERAKNMLRVLRDL